MATPTRATGAAPHLADCLWSEFRAAADRVLGRTPRPWGDAHHDEVRGAVYLVLADLVAVFVDRVERTPDPARREALDDLLAG